MSNPRPFRKNQHLELIIDDLAFEGKGIAKLPTEKGLYVVFVPNTIPGQKVSVRIIKVKNSYAEAKLLKVLERSAQEVSHDYHPIPGAPYLSLPLEKQHEYKRKSTIELFRRIGKVDNAAELLDSFLQSPRSLHYRNKMEYSFSAVGYDAEMDREYDGFALGFKKRGQWLSVESLQGDSGLFDQMLESQMHRIEQHFRERGHSAWHALQHSGFCRFLTVRKSFDRDQLLVNLTTSSAELKKFDRTAFLNLMQDILGSRLAGLIHTINDDRGDRPVATDGESTVLFGDDHIVENILGLNFKISPESFFQTNPGSAEKLYAKALDYVFESNMGEAPLVLDLFSGTGTITQLLAQRSRDKKVLGVEIVPEAVEDARRSARENQVENIDFYCGDVGRFLLDNPQYEGAINTLVMDPPRAGIAPKTLRKIMRLQAERMVYISCNPATQARDINSLKEAGYIMKKFSLADQFPHTAHIESVALFERQ